MNKITFLPISSVLLALATLPSIPVWAQAQQSIAPCQPPQANEYLLLVTTQTKESTEQLQRALPANIQMTVCRYQNDTVTRIAGFRQLEDANDWARYVKEIAGLSTYVIRPVSTTASTSTNNSPPYNPQPLGEGYAVLVDYFNQPQLAAQLKQQLDNDVGLVSFGKRPYLLAMYTTNESKANSTLRRLSDRGFWTMVVDSRRVTLLKPVIGF